MQAKIDLDEKNCLFVFCGKLRQKIIAGKEIY
jgi:hypothetical protein